MKSQYIYEEIKLKIASFVFLAITLSLMIILMTYQKTDFMPNTDCSGYYIVYDKELVYRHNEIGFALYLANDDTKKTATIYVDRNTYDTYAIGDKYTS